MKKRKINHKKTIKILILFVSVIVVIALVFLFINKVFNKNTSTNKVSVIDTVGTYTLDDNETAYYKNLFNQLKEELKKTSVNEENYAKLITQLFITDFFTLDNKISKNDIGGLQFVYNNYRSDFEKNAKDTIYHSIKNNLYGDRNQELPVVHSVEVTRITKNNYSYLDQKDSNAYYIDVQITYEKDLSYQKTASLILVHNNDLLEIAKMSNE